MINSLEQFKKLSEDERNFCIFEALKNLSRDELDKRYASKLTERIVYTAVGLVLTSVFVAIIGLVITNN